ncbi:Eukaryotic translation initiation factor 3 subunit B [Zancudomyces culisetae]|nr:Eukaryotic translation initiation factor 3 subunit B [Zancudomyces culisetae]|eukprot:OMH79562.1 Eukaryotic translation initiation factor 3 subunit B [Zancudomyces culisetae]
MDVEKYSRVPEEFVVPPKTEFVAKEHMKYWLLDELSRDQLCTLADQNITALWNNGGKVVETILTRKDWTETYLQWSTQGTYLMTMHRQGVVLWGGSSWNKIMRFVHLGVRLVDTSPQETYIITYSNEPLRVEAVNDVLGAGNEHLNPFTEADEGNHFCVWETQTGRLLRTFGYVTNDNGEPVTKFSWPCFKWSATENYLARMTPGSKISIYEAPQMTMVGKKSLNVPGVAGFDWRPNDDIKTRTRKNQDTIAYWFPEVDNQPGRVTIMTVPTMEILRTKNMISVKDISLHWNPTGDLLCAKVLRYTKSKKSVLTNLEIFRVSERDIPSEIVEVKGGVVAFAWEPQSPNHRFAIIHVDSADLNPPPINSSGMATAAVKSNVSFYQFVRSKSKLSVKESFVLLKTLEKKNTTSIYWSPKGRYIVLATLRTISVWDLEFWDLDAEVSGVSKAEAATASIQLLKQTEHYGVTDLEWDPSGRYVLTTASSWRHSMENGYVIWDFKGEQLLKSLQEKFKQALWRPRPPSLLSDSAKAKIRKNLSSYSSDFDEQDRVAASAANTEQINLRRRLISEWSSWRQTCSARIKAISDSAAKLGYVELKPIEQDQEVIEEIVEELIDETVEFV